MHDVDAVPATMLTEHCYWWMFLNCSNLTDVKCLATNISSNGCTEGWLNGVSTSGTFIKALGMTGCISGADGIPEGWTIISE